MHYNEFEAIRLARKLIEEDEDDDENENNGHEKASASSNNANDDTSMEVDGSIGKQSTSSQADTV